MTHMRNRLVLGAAVAVIALLAMVFNADRLASQRAEGSAPVTIVSPIPLPVSDAGLGAPFTITSARTSPQGEPPEVAFAWQVPPDYVAVIEHVSVRLYSCAGSTMSLQDFRLSAGDKDVFLIPVHVPAALANSQMANEQTKFAVEPGETIHVEAENFAFSSTGCGHNMDATISGVVVPAF